MNDLVTQLNALITQLNGLLRENSDPDVDRHLWDLRHLLSALRDAALGRVYDRSAPAYGTAMTAMADANSAASAAVADIARIQTAIDQITVAAKAADEVIGLFGRLA